MIFHQGNSYNWYAINLPLIFHHTIPRSPIQNISGWWFFATPLKNMSSSIGMMKFQIYGKIKKWQPNHQPVIINKQALAEWERPSNKRRAANAFVVLRPTPPVRWDSLSLNPPWSMAGKCQFKMGKLWENMGSKKTHGHVCGKNHWTNWAIQIF